jgi:hypothetical protein
VDFWKQNTIYIFIKAPWENNAVLRDRIECFDDLFIIAKRTAK